MSTFLQSIRVKLQGIRRYFATVQRLVRLLWRANPPLFVISCSLTLLNGLLPLTSIFITSALLQTLVSGVHPSTETALPAKFVLLLVLMAGISLLTQVLQRLNMAVQQLHQARVTNHVQLLIAEKASEIDLACFEEPEFHNHMRTAANEASFRIPMFLDRLMTTGSTLATIFSLATVLLLWHAWIIPVILLGSLATFWVSTHFSAMRVNVIAQRAETERKKFYLKTLLTSEEAAKEIRLFGLQNFLLTSFRTLLETTYRQDRRLAFRELSYAGIAATLLALVQPVLFAFTAIQALQGIISIGLFSLYTQSILQVESNWTQLVMTQSMLHEDTLFATHLFDFLATQPHAEAPRPLAKNHPAALSRTPHIEFRDVSFSYPGTTHPVLKNVSFVICPGETVALVGENGAGKTTLVKLLAGLYEPTEGHILLDGVDIQTLARDELRTHLSIIFQDYTIYHFSARENIGMGRVRWLHDVQRIEQAAQRSGLKRVIEELPDGYETVLGRFWEKGHELSGGQRQLVALTRALLRDAPILILDEPSAALDVYTEQHFFQQLLADRKTERLQTVVFISHRFTTVRRADRILALEHGRLIEQGTHEELIARGGSYSEMFNMQAAPYATHASQNVNTSNTRALRRNMLLPTWMSENGKFMHTEERKT